MKLIFKNIALLVIFVVVNCSLKAQNINLTSSIGTLNSTYPNLKAAFDAINLGTHKGDILLEIIGNTVETTTATLIRSDSLSASYRTVVIRPSGGLPREIRGNFVGSLISLQGADSVIIDGLNTNGNSLTIVNDSTGLAQTIRFNLDASRNTIKNCTLKGSGKAIGSSIILFSGARVTGNDSNTISYCRFDTATYGGYLNAVLSIGSTATGSENGFNLVENCLIGNFFNPTLATNGILLSAGSINWTIQNNRLYEQIPLSYTTANVHRGIAVITGTNHLIHNNTIGFADTTAAGKYTMSGAVATTFIGILGTFGTTGNNTISSNTISEITLTTTATTATVSGVFAGISVTSGNVNIINNIIGGLTDTASINITTGAAGALMGINSSSTGSVVIQGNQLGALRIVGSGATIASALHGINISGVAASLVIRQNTIGNSTANNIRAGILGTTTGNTFVNGIQTPSTSTSVVIASNTIQNLVSFSNSSSTFIRGIFTNTGTSTTSTSRIDSNTVFNLTGYGALVGLAEGAAAVQGIQFSPGINSIVSNNIIYNLFGMNTGTTQIVVAAIAHGSATNTSIFNNRIYHLRNSATGTVTTAPGVATGIGIRSGTTSIKVFNNFISLGVNDTGNTSFVGIWANHGSTPNPIDSIIHNNVYIDGSVSSGGQPSFGFYRGDFSTTARSATVVVYGNQFINWRRGGSRNHYAISDNYGAVTSAGGWQSNSSNRNNLYANNISKLARLNSEDCSMDIWQLYYLRDQNSINISPIFTDTNTSDLHLFGPSKNDSNFIIPRLNGYNIDFDGEVRNPLGTQIGADQYVIYCTAPPVAGLSNTTKSKTCSNELFTLTLIGSSSGVGIRYQWQASTNGLSGPYTNLPSDTNAMLTKTQSATNAYRCIVSCNGLFDTSTSVLVTTLNTPLAGSYYIDLNKALSDTNYHSLTSIFSELKCRGVSNRVTINITPGNPIFLEQLVIDSIPGSSFTNQVIVNGNGNTISSNATVVVRFNSARYITLDSLNIVSTNSKFGIQIGNRSSYINIQNCIIDVGKSSASSQCAGIVISGSITSATTTGNNGSNISIINNSIYGGFYGIAAVGSTGYLHNTGLTILNNKVVDFYFYGIYIAHGDSVLIQGNDINRATRSVVADFFGITQLSSRFVKVYNNSIHSSGNGSYNAFPIYLTNSVNSIGYETEYINNQIYNIRTSGRIYGIYGLTNSLNGIKIYHNSISLYTPIESNKEIRGVFFNVAPNNVQFRNNIISITGEGFGVKTGIYLTTASASFFSNNNVIHVGASNANNFGFWGNINCLTLSDWQITTGEDSNSFVFNPVFKSINDLIPMSINIDNKGVPLGITNDILDSLKSLTSPDIGAFEFNGANKDIGLIKGNLLQSNNFKCYSSNDTIMFTILNNIGDTIHFINDTLKIIWSVTGPVNSSGIIQIDSGRLAPSNTLTVSSNSVNRSIPGDYFLTAYLHSNGFDAIRSNDSLIMIAPMQIKPILKVIASSLVVNTPTEKVKIKSITSGMLGKSNFISEICHFKEPSASAPPGGWPSYLTADDYIELTGLPGFDLAGYSLEEWAGDSLQFKVTFPSNTVYSPLGIMVLATGQLGFSAPSPSNFYYHTGNVITHTPLSPMGYVLKSPSNQIVDAVAMANYSFPAISGITINDWTGTIPSNSSSGCRLNGPDLDNSSNWISTSSTHRHDPNILNLNVPIPFIAPTSGYYVYLNSNLISTTATDTIVGPFTNPGLYEYIIEYTNPCGTFKDTIAIVANGCSTPPVAGVAVSSKSNTCPNEIFHLSLSGAIDRIGISYQWQVSSSGIPGSFVNIIGATDAQISRSQILTNSYRCIMTCSGQSDTSSIVQVTTNNTPFAGTYTVDLSSPVSITNYHSLNELINNIECRGVSSAVTINMAASNAPFNTEIIIDSIPGVSDTNTVTINGNDNTIVTTANFVIQFNNTRFITINNLNLIATTGEIGVSITNGSKFITIQNSSINIINQDLSFKSAAIFISNPILNQSAVVSDVSIINNKIEGGVHGIASYGEYGNLNVTRLVITGNKIEDFLSTGIVLSNTDTVVVMSNEISQGRTQAFGSFTGIYQTNSEYVRVHNNRIYQHQKISGFATGIEIRLSDNTIGYETEYINNEIYNLSGSSGAYGILVAGAFVNRIKFYHNTIYLNGQFGTSGLIKGIYLQVADSNIDFRNNIISITGSSTGIKIGIHLDNPAVTFRSNNNVIHIESTNYSPTLIGRIGTSDAITLANWRTISSQDSNSVSLNPVFASNIRGIPLSPGINNMGAPLGITLDILNTTRSTTNPDVGAHEFNSLTRDLKLTSAQLIQSSSSKCYSNSDTIKFSILNNLGDSINFSADSIKLIWNVTGPINSSGIINLNSGILSKNESIIVFATNANRSLPGTYFISAYLDSNNINMNRLNDTIQMLSTASVKSLLSVTPKNTFLNTPSATVRVIAESSIFLTNSNFITEICHWRRATGATPSAGWPPYLIADDYIELTGIPGSDLNGYVFEEWSGTALQHTFTFPKGSIFSPSGTMILANGELSTSVPSPSDFYYHSGNTTMHTSTGVMGYILKDPYNKIVDVVCYGSYSFPASSGVNPNDWSGSTPALRSAGIRLNGQDLNNDTQWILEWGQQRQDPNILNKNVPKPVIKPSAGYKIFLNGSQISTTAVDTVVGPFNIPGTYEYVFEYTTTCGTFSDTVRIIAGGSVPINLLSFDAKAANKDVLLNWSTASETNNKGFYIERSRDGKLFETVQFVKGVANSNKIQQYTFTDMNALSKATLWYYRLRQVDFDGTSTYSEIKQVKIFQNRINNIEIAPNPFFNKFRIVINNENECTALITLIDMYGQTVTEQIFKLYLGENTLSIDKLENLASGVYTIVVNLNGEQSICRIVKE